MRHPAICRRPVVSTIAAATLLAAFSVAGTATASTSPPAGTDGVDSAPASSGSDCDSDTTATATGPVSVTDSFGRTVELDAPAERIAVLEWQQVEDALTLCVVPVAIADVEGYTTWDTAEALPEGVTDVGGRGEPSLDALFGAEPDLIIVEAYTAEDEIIGQLESYGLPVLATKGADAADPIQNMLDTLHLIAEVTGREERADVVEAEFETALADAQATVADVELASTDFVYFDGWIDGGNVAIRPFGQGSLVGELGESLGLTNAWTGEVDPAYGLGLTDIEGMVAVGDANLFHTGTSDPESEILDAMASNPIWQSLPAVEEGRAVGFPPGIWTFGGPRSSQQILDAYVAILTA